MGQDMRGTLVAGLVVIGLLSGCGVAQRLNPLNWFGGAEDTASAVSVQRRADDRPLMQSIAALSVDPTPAGAIVKATGIPPTQGYWEGDLVLVEQTPGRLLYEFRAYPPPRPARVSTEASRAVVVGTFLSERALRGVREIAVTGTGNALVVRR